LAGLIVTSCGILPLIKISAQLSKSLILYLPFVFFFFLDQCGKLTIRGQNIFHLGLKKMPKLPVFFHCFLKKVCNIDFIFFSYMWRCAIQLHIRYFKHNFKSHGLNEEHDKHDKSLLNIFNILPQKEISAKIYIRKGCFFKFGVEVGVGESIENAPLV
jgi:hypothetical protein